MLMHLRPASSKVILAKFSGVIVAAATTNQMLDTMPTPTNRRKICQCLARRKKDAIRFMLFSELPSEVE